ncbi:MAG: type II toxin-antitoxin system RelE/ParE family toxin [Gammaproteobacteria bacterium]|nr:type II toxin-antitoxin system RelE/ParE family toxin [Gammaproteobacteria bacterium]
MTDTAVIVHQMPVFKKAYKKLHQHQKQLIQQAIQTIIATPDIGEVKRGDLAGVYVYKFKLDQREMSLAYEWDPKRRLLLALGVHENFYRDLKKRL